MTPALTPTAVPAGVTPQVRPAELTSSVVADSPVNDWTSDPRLWITGSTLLAGGGLAAVAFGRRRRATSSN